MSRRTWSAEDVERLYQRHGAALTAYAGSFVPDFAAAEDIVHGIFLRLLRGDTALAEQPVAYLYRAVRNAALNARRDGARSESLGDREPFFAHAGGNREAALALQQGLQALPEEQREVVMMRIWSGMTLEEISAASRAPLNTVASRYRYALSKLRAALAPEFAVTKKPEFP